MNDHEYDARKIPDLIELRKQLSEANKLRHKFWIQLRTVRNQIGRYINAHGIEEKDFQSKLEDLTEAKRVYYECEWDTARQISLKDLNSMIEVTNRLWQAPSQFKEDLIRKRSKKPLSPEEDFFYGPQCENCRLPLPPGRRKFCSDVCADQHRKMRYKRKRVSSSIVKAGGKKTSYTTKKSATEGPNPQPGPGEKHTDFTCDHFDDCLNKAIEENWIKWNCEECTVKQFS